LDGGAEAAVDFPDARSDNVAAVLAGAGFSAVDLALKARCQGLKITANDIAGHIQGCVQGFITGCAEPRRSCQEYSNKITDKLLD